LPGFFLHSHFFIFIIVLYVLNLIQIKKIQFK
jgi:hypothetical protein